MYAKTVAHNSTYTDVANPHNRIDFPLAAGTPVVGESVVGAFGMI
jgi:hypothetical protein